MQTVDYANLVRAVTACHALRSRTGLQGFRSEIGYQFFDEVLNRAGKITDFFLKQGKGLRKGSAHPHPTFLEVLSRFFRRILYTNGGNCVRRSLLRPWKLGLRIVA